MSITEKAARWAGSEIGRVWESHLDANSVITSASYADTGLEVSGLPVGTYDVDVSCAIQKGTLAGNSYSCPVVAGKLVFTNTIPRLVSRQEGAVNSNSNDTVRFHMSPDLSDWTSNELKVEPAFEGVDDILNTSPNTVLFNRYTMRVSVTAAGGAIKIQAQTSAAPFVAGTTMIYAHSFIRATRVA